MLRYGRRGPVGTTTTGQSASARCGSGGIGPVRCPRRAVEAMVAVLSTSDARAPHFVERVVGARGERAPVSEHGGEAGEAPGAAAGGTAGGGEGERRGERAALTSLSA
jgi:hypothetical protein